MLNYVSHAVKPAHSSRQPLHSIRVSAQSAAKNVFISADILLSRVGIEKAKNTKTFCKNTNLKTLDSEFILTTSNFDAYQREILNIKRGRMMEIGKIVAEIRYAFTEHNSSSVIEFPDHDGRYLQ